MKRFFSFGGTNVIVMTKVSSSLILNLTEFHVANCILTKSTKKLHGAYTEGTELGGIESSAALRTFSCMSCMSCSCSKQTFTAHTKEGLKMLFPLHN